MPIPKRMDLTTLDLNLLRVFDQLYRQRRVAAVARTLGLSQPGVSNALARLRRALQDDLFVKTPGGMQPTAVADKLAEPVATALAMLSDALARQVRFHPPTAQRRFHVSMSDIGEVYFLPRLIPALRREAPGVTISTLRDTSVDLTEEMRRGRVDLTVGYVTDLQAGFYQQRLFEQRYVCLFRHDHPLAGSHLTRAGYEAAEHVTVASAGTAHGRLLQAIERLEVRRDVRLALPHFVALPYILAVTDLVATVPEKLAEACVEPFRLRQAPLPFELPAIQITMFWHALAHRDPGNQWLRSLIALRFQEHAGTPGAP